MRWRCGLCLTLLWAPVAAFAETTLTLATDVDWMALTSEIKQVVPELNGVTWKAATRELIVIRQTGEFTTAELTAIQQRIAAHDPLIRANRPDPSEELEAAIASVSTASIVDPAAKAALDELKQALTGKIRQGKVKAERP